MGLLAGAAIIMLGNGDRVLCELGAEEVARLSEPALPRTYHLAVL